MQKIIKKEEIQQRVKELAEAIWGTDDKDNTWEYPNKKFYRVQNDSYDFFKNCGEDCEPESIFSLYNIIFVNSFS